MIEIEIKRISPHPKNPRKDLGDLTELTDSIRTFGILQNLTVVPDEAEGYTVICGHRRLAAAEAAGLETVPCIIAKGMDEKTQVSIMLLENMQRSDLTVQEEAQGLQMMLDLGSSIAEIVEETGLSETKVRHRVKMNELDQDLLADKLAGQVNINDLIKLEQIRDIDKRNELLEMVGTNNFDWRYRTAIEDQKKEDTIDLILDVTEQWPTPEFADGYYWKYDTYGELKWGAAREEVAAFTAEMRAKAEELGRPALIAEKSGAFVIAFERQRDEVSEENLEYQRQREKRDRKNEALKEMREKILESWSDFMRAVCKHSESWFGSKQIIILDTLIESGIGEPESYIDLDLDDVRDILGMEEDASVQTLINRRWATLAAMTYAVTVPGRYESTWNYSDQKYNEDGAAHYIAAAEYLELLGYKLSDEEIAFIGGTSELYGGDEE